LVSSLLQSLFCSFVMFLFFFYGFRDHRILNSFPTRRSSDLESTYEGDANITAARGVLADGTYWRFLGTFGETISCQTKDGEAARRFDLMLDGVCLGR